MDVVEVDAPRQLVTVHPTYWPAKQYIVFRPDREDPTPLKWNRVDDLSEDERDGLVYHVDHQPRPGMSIETRDAKPQVFTGRNESELETLGDPEE